MFLLVMLITAACRANTGNANVLGTSDVEVLGRLENLVERLVIDMQIQTNKTGEVNKRLELLEKTTLHDKNELIKQLATLSQSTLDSINDIGRRLDNLEANQNATADHQGKLVSSCQFN